MGREGWGKRCAKAALGRMVARPAPREGRRGAKESRLPVGEAAMFILEWSRESTKNLGFLFSYDLERNFYRNFLVETYNSLVGTNFLHVLHNDRLAVDFIRK